MHARVTQLRDRLCTAAATLQDADESGIAARLLDDFDSVATRVELRIEELVLCWSRPLGEVYNWVTDGAEQAGCGAVTATGDRSSDEHPCSGRAGQNPPQGA